MREFYAEHGALDFNGLNVTTTGGFYVNNGGSFSLANFGGRKVTVGGSAALNGQMADALYIDPTSPCTLAVTGTLTASGATLGNCKATGAAGTATYSTDAGGNYNWTFTGVVEDYSQWHYSTKVYINTKEGGANISTNQLKFPLLVRLTSANFNFNQAQSAGQDVRFSKPNGTHFNYQIERWNSANSTAEIWVKVDTVWGYNDAQYIWMYWGKSNAADSSSGSSVFDTANGFAGVWHLGEGSGNAFDATFNGITDTAKGSIKYQETGGIGYSDSLSGTASYFKAGNAYNTLLNMSARKKVTLSAWVNRAGNVAAGATEAISGKYAWNGVNYREYQIGNNSGNGFEFFISSDGTSANETILNSGVIPVNGTWYFVTGVMDGTNMTIFVNGAQKAQVGKTAISATTNAPFKIGMSDDDNGSNRQYWNGQIDEVIVADTNRSADWIALCYQTQKANQTTVTLQENYANWQYSQNLYFNTKSSGAGVQNNVVKFPVLVRLDSTVFDFPVAQSNGQDVRFAKADGTHLYYEIEQWSQANKTAAIWVRVDTIYGNDSTHYITMYWGNSKVNGISSSAAVFDTGNGFRGVFHMKDASGSATEATANQLNGAANGGITYQQSGDIAYANGFSGSGTYFDATNSSQFNMSSIGKVTVSAWVNRSGPAIAGVWEGIAGKFEWSSGNYREYCIYNNSSSGFAFSVSTDGTSTNETSLSSGIIPSNGSWYYVTGTMDGSNMFVYTNGALSAEAAKTTIYGSTNADFKIGVMDDNGYSMQYWNGFIDEVRVERVNRSADWIKLCYQNQKATQSLIVFNNENYALWADSQKVTLNTSQSGANVATTQLNFPVLLRLTSSNFNFAQAQDNGGDIRFASSLGKKLSYQIERWNRASQLAEVWVLADSVKGNNGTQYITMYWGNPGVASKSNGSAVFSTSNGYAGVWHLNQALAARAPSCLTRPRTRITGRQRVQ